MFSRNIYSEETMTWLLEPESPGARYLAMRDLLDLPASDPNLIAVCALAHENGPIGEVLAKMLPDGSWEKAGPGYNPKYRSTVWSLTLLAQLGASIEVDPRIGLAINHILDHALCSNGQFSYNGAPSGTIDCLHGNLCAALLDLGCRDPRLEQAFDWMARTVTGDGIAPNTEKDARLRYYAYKCGPGFKCGVNDKLPCAWGAAKVMLAFGKLPKEMHTARIDAAIQTGIEFLFSVDPADAAYPSPGDQKPSSNWWKFGFPVFYITDILQTVEALALLGCGQDPRLQHALELVRSRGEPDGRWNLEYDYRGKTWGDYGQKKTPNKWVTIRALKPLKMVGEI